MKDFLERDLPEPAWILEGILPERGVISLVAKAKIGKTWWALQVCISLAAGLPFLGRQVRQARTVYLMEEGDKSTMQERSRRLVAAFGSVPDDSYLGVRQGFTFGDEAGTDRAIRALRPLAPDLVVIDPLNQVLGGADENDNTAMAAVMKRFSRIRDELGATVLIIHHPSRGRSDSSAGDAGRGASAVPAATDGNITLIQKSETTFVIAGSSGTAKTSRSRWSATWTP